MFGPWVDALHWAKSHGPYKALKKQRLNFIMIHCRMKKLPCFSYTSNRELTSPVDLYIISMTIIGSILLYPVGNLNYIDALFFASGCATQSGLNTWALLRIWCCSLIWYFPESTSMAWIPTNRLVSSCTPLLDSADGFAGHPVFHPYVLHSYLHTFVRGFCSAVLVWTAFPEYCEGST